MIKRYLAFVSCALLVVLAACSRIPSEPVKITYKALSRFSDGPVRVLSGELDSIDKTPVAFPIAGKIATVLVELGDTVIEDQQMATMDLGPLQLQKIQVQANLDKAKEDLKNANDKLRMAQQMLQAKVGTPKDVQVAGEALETAKQNIIKDEDAFQAAQDAMDRATLRAPKAGLVSKRDVVVGDIVGAGQRIFEIHPAGSLRVFIHVPKDLLSFVQNGTQVASRVVDENQGGIVGTIEALEALPEGGDAASAHVTIAPQQSLRAGMKVDVSVSMFDAKKPEWLLPKSFFGNIKGDKGLLYVYDATNGVARTLTVSLGNNSQDNRVEVLDGLHEGDKIIIKAEKALGDGYPVSAMSSTDIPVYTPQKLDY